MTPKRNNNIGSLLTGQGINKSFKAKSGDITQVLKSLDIEISAGEFTALMGPSGAGKSTLLHLLGSIDQPDSGKISLLVNGSFVDYSELKSDQISSLRNKHIGFIFQFHHLLPEFSAVENVMIPSLIANLSKADAQRKALELLDVVGVADRRDHKPNELSGGEQQRVAIARALINEPVIVFADEPTGNLDRKNSDAVLNLIQDLRKRISLTFLVATHSADVASIAERVLTMKDGKVVENDNK